MPRRTNTLNALNQARLLQLLELSELGFDINKLRVGYKRSPKQAARAGSSAASGLLEHYQKYVTEGVFGFGGSSTDRSKKFRGADRKAIDRIGRENVLVLGREAFDTRGIQNLLRRARSKKEAEQLASERRTFDRLKESPFFESLLGDLSGTSAGLANAILASQERTLGGAAASGLNLRDPLVQSRVLGPGALQGFLAQRELQRQAGLSALTLTRGPGTASALGNPRSRGDIFNQLLASQDLFQRGQIANVQAGLAESAQRADQSALNYGVIAGLTGATAGLGFGAQAGLAGLAAAKGGES